MKVAFWIYVLAFVWWLASSGPGNTAYSSGVAIVIAIGIGIFVYRAAYGHEDEDG